MPPDLTPREALAARQAELVRALAERSTDHDFAADRLRAASDSLLRKRARAVAKAWPAAIRALGEGFDGAFADYARRSPLRPDETAWHDGLRFLQGLPDNRLDDDARIAVLHARLHASRARVAIRTIGLPDGRGRCWGFKLPWLGVRVIRPRPRAKGGKAGVIAR